MGIILLLQGRPKNRGHFDYFDENLYRLKGHIAQKLMKEFPSKGWNEQSLPRLLKHNDMVELTGVQGRQ